MSSLIKTASTALPTEYGIFQFDVFQEKDGKEHVALVYGPLDPAQPVLVRVHSQCLTSETFLSLKCDCRWQLHQAMRLIAERGSGVIVYLQEEGRGIGLTNKIRAYYLQEEGLDTVAANHALGLKADYRDYAGAAAILKHYGITKVELLTNNPEKVRLLTEHGLEIIQRVPLATAPNAVNQQYFQTKKDVLGHYLAEK